MRSLKLTVRYDGSQYAGWQVQPDCNTVQQELEQAWTRITGESIRVIASGRTDSGVHALGQVVSISTETDKTDEILCRALNAHLPNDIAVMKLEPAPEGFHAIRDAKSKRYRYWLGNGGVEDIFWRDYGWHFRLPLNVDLMRQAASRLLGTHDFASFQAARSDRKTTVRTIIDLPIDEMVQDDTPLIRVEVCADGFLYNMVRNIVGSLVAVGQQEQPPEWIDEVLAAKDRRAAGATAPARGLFLVSVDYD